jgi:hypothetical protein
MPPEEKGAAGKPEGGAAFIPRSCLMQETSSVDFSGFRGFRGRSTTPPTDHQDFLSSRHACSPKTVVIVGKEIARHDRGDGGKPEGGAAFIPRSRFMQETSGVDFSGFRGFPSGGSTPGPRPCGIQPSLKGYRGESDSLPRQCSAFP